MASTAEKCVIQVQEKSGILKKNPENLKKDKALLPALVEQRVDVIPFCKGWRDSRGVHLRGAGFQVNIPVLGMQWQHGQASESRGI
jgi:hypothetical protein